MRHSVERDRFARLAVLPVLLLSSVSARADLRASDCRAIEQPAANGDPVIIMPAGVVPVIGPLEFADRLRNGTHLMRVGHGPADAVTCVQYVAAREGEPPHASEGQARWVAHVEASFWFKPPFAPRIS